ncbi:transmembrane protein 59-like [Diorhabda carinulata]|uniref:transmembrane protein 59-like n=1 Tax=Diorhabda sublineata TaxID=1163346 RepID=UPI0024E049D4|nr:transmembrane protein 59-like [Diorhabda sublineata]XP_057658541.1 transmembrane protein 59-like [Diorhabda carinulata]
MVIRDVTCLMLIIGINYARLTTAFVTDQCISVCKNVKLPTLDLDFYEQVVCQRGCRFFNIIKFKDVPNVNRTKKECHLSCGDSYIVKKEKDVCQTGCNLMAKEQETFISSFLIETENSIVLASPDRDIELDILSDPSIRSQLEIGFNIDYKIPATNIRTMPIEIEEEFKVNERDWLDCASKNSGIPRWILLLVILSSVLVALWLSFTLEKRNSVDEEVHEMDIPDEKLILTSDEVKEQNIVEIFPVYLNVSEKEAPPKYTDRTEDV